MTQEVQVIITLEVDVTREKKYLINFAKKLTEDINSKHYEFIKFEVKEEAEIYNNE